MRIAELYNHQHKLANINLWIRGMYIVPAFILCAISSSNWFNLLVLLVYMILIQIITAIRIQKLFRLIIIPLLFVLYGCLALSISFESQQAFLTIGDFSLGFSEVGVHQAIQVFTKSTALIMIFYLGLLVYTISEMAEMMKKLFVPTIITDLFIITYKFIENLMTSSRNIYTSQKSRLAYTGNTNKMYCFTMLITGVFQGAINQSDHFEVAMTSRNCTGNYLFIRPNKIFRIKHLLTPVLFACLLFLTLIIFSRYGW